MEKIAEFIARKMVKHEIIDEADEMFYCYALECLFICFVNIVTMFIIAIYMKKLVECCFFLIIFIPLRSLCGGVHMTKWYSCYVASCGIIAMILWMSGWIVVEYPVLIAGLVLGNIVIWKLAPCVHENHLLEQEEVTKAKIKAIRYSMLIGFITIVIFPVVGVHHTVGTANTITISAGTSVVCTADTNFPSAYKTYFDQALMVEGVNPTSTYIQSSVYELAIPSSLATGNYVAVKEFVGKGGNWVLRGTTNPEGAPSIISTGSFSFAPIGPTDKITYKKA